MKLWSKRRVRSPGLGGRRRCFLALFVRAGSSKLVACFTFLRSLSGFCFGRVRQAWSRDDFHVLCHFPDWDVLPTSTAFTIILVM